MLVGLIICGSLAFVGIACLIASAFMARYLDGAE